LIADLHARNFVRVATGQHYLIDLVAGPLPVVDPIREPLIAEWLRRVELDPQASLLRSVPDAEL
jgi:hypothetical protein